MRSHTTMTSEEILQQQYSHSLKLEETAKGVRVHVHVYANSNDDVIEQTFKTYKDAKDKAKAEGITLAPMENNGTKWCQILLVK